jgi:hypothetical protein
LLPLHLEGGTRVFGRLPQVENRDLLLLEGLSQVLV